jgi:rubrerythrin
MKTESEFSPAPTIHAIRENKPAFSYEATGKFEYRPSRMHVDYNNQGFVVADTEAREVCVMKSDQYSAKTAHLFAAAPDMVTVLSETFSQLAQLQAMIAMADSLPKDTHEQVMKSMETINVQTWKVLMLAKGVDDIPEFDHVANEAVIVAKTRPELFDSLRSSINEPSDDMSNTPVAWRCKMCMHIHTEEMKPDDCDNCDASEFERNKIIDINGERPWSTHPYECLKCHARYENDTNAKCTEKSCDGDVLYELF